MIVTIADDSIFENFGTWVALESSERYTEIIYLTARSDLVNYIGCRAQKYSFLYISSLLATLYEKNYNEKA